MYNQKDKLVFVGKVSFAVASVGLATYLLVSRYSGNDYINRLRKDFINRLKRHNMELTLS